MTTNKHKTWMLRTCRERKKRGGEEEVKALADV